jgi:hypothetical protein
VPGTYAMSTTPVLDLLTDPAHWTQGTFARNKYGNPVNSAGPTAVCWCLLGAINLCYPDEERGAVCQRLARGEDITRFNDAPTTTHQMVLDRVREAAI